MQEFLESLNIALPNADSNVTTGFKSVMDRVAEFEDVGAGFDDLEPGFPSDKRLSKYIHKAQRALDAALDGNGWCYEHARPVGFGSMRGGGKRGRPAAVPAVDPVLGELLGDLLARSAMPVKSPVLRPHQPVPVVGLR